MTKENEYWKTPTGRRLEKEVGEPDRLYDEEPLEARPNPGALNDPAVRGDSTLDDLTIKDARDASLGLTNLGDVPPDDWAAETGPTVTGEEGTEAVTNKLADYSSQLDPAGRGAELDPDDVAPTAPCD